MRLSGTRNRGQHGFTLVELLIVIAVLGSLSGVAVIAVGAIDDGAEQAACDADARVVRTAAESYFALEGAYVDEDGLVSAGLLADPSELHDMTVDGLAYEIVPVGDCVDAGGVDEVADGGGEAADTDAAEKATAEQAAADAAAKDAERAEAEAAAKEAAEKAAAEGAAKDAGTGRGRGRSEGSGREGSGRERSR